MNLSKSLAILFISLFVGGHSDDVNINVGDIGQKLKSWWRRASDDSENLSSGQEEEDSTFDTINSTISLPQISATEGTNDSMSPLELLMEAANYQPDMTANGNWTDVGQDDQFVDALQNALNSATSESINQNQTLSPLDILTTATNVSSDVNHGMSPLELLNAALPIPATPTTESPLPSQVPSPLNGQQFVPSTPSPQDVRPVGAGSSAALDLLTQAASGQALDGEDEGQNLGQSEEELLIQLLTAQLQQLKEQSMYQRPSPPSPFRPQTDYNIPGYNPNLFQAQPQFQPQGQLQGQLGYPVQQQQPDYLRYPQNPVINNWNQYPQINQQFPVNPQIPSNHNVSPISGQPGYQTGGGRILSRHEQHRLAKEERRALHDRQKMERRIIRANMY